MPATLVIAAHGTRSAAGTATTRALASSVAAARPDVPVVLSFLDVASPSLRSSLDDLAGAPVVVVPLLLSAGYHVTTDIPAVVSGRPDVRVARHLGPDAAVLRAVADRLASIATGAARTTVLAAVESSRESARADVASAAAGLATLLDRPVEVVALDGSTAAALAAMPQPVEVAAYLLAEGGFLDLLHADSPAAIAEPIGVHPALVDLVWTRYDEVADW